MKYVTTVKNGIARMKLWKITRNGTDLSKCQLYKNRPFGIMDMVFIPLWYNGIFVMDHVRMQVCYSCNMTDNFL